MYGMSRKSIVKGGGQNIAALLFFLAVFLVQPRVHAQMASQTLTLRAGWNAVYLEVHPETNRCDEVFTNSPIETIWGWNRRFAQQFVPGLSSNLLPPNPDWLAYFPVTHPLRPRQTLHLLEGGKSYLIKLADNAPSQTLILSGRPALRQTDWFNQSFNLVGFSVDRTNAPTFASFFSPTRAHTNAFLLGANGVWQPVTAPATTRLTNGQAFWIYTRQPSDFAGPIRLTLEQIDRLEFGALLQEQTIRIRNAYTNSSATFLLRLLPSEDPRRAGDLPLSYWAADVTNAAFGWFPFPLPNALAFSNVPALKEVELRIAVRRQDLANRGVYQALLEVTEATPGSPVRGSSRWVIPVSAERATPLGNIGSLLATKKAKNSTAIDSKAGLWIGNAIINQVNEPANASNPIQPVAAKFPFQLRLLIHVNKNGQAALLQKAIQMAKNGTRRIDDPQVVEEPAELVLFTDEMRAKQGAASGRYTGITINDGQLVGRRYSSTGFAFSGPVLMGGDVGLDHFGKDGLVYNCTVAIGMNDSLNPYRHAFHPDHDNKDVRGDPITEEIEGFSVRRDLEFEFTRDDPNPNSLSMPGFGDDQVGGIYRETIYGLHRVPLKVQGMFRLRRVSMTPELNDGM